MTEFVRRITSGGDLTYHDAGCRHAQREDAEAVPREEVVDALAQPKFKRVKFRGKIVSLNVCGICLPVPEEWPYG